MGVKEFWKNRSYFQKGAIIGLIFGLLAYLGCLIYSMVIYSELIPKSMLNEVFFFGLIILVVCGLLFGFIGFLVGLIRRGLWKKFVLMILIVILIYFTLFYLYPFIKQGKLNKILNKEIEYSGLVEYDMESPFICGNCLGVGDPYEWQSYETGECCYLLEYDEHENLEEFQTIKIRAIAKNTGGEASRVSRFLGIFEVGMMCATPYGCDRLFFEVKEVTILKNVTVEDCESMGFRRSRCYAYFAKKLDDFNLCEKVEEEDLSKAWCIAETARNRGDCETIGAEAFVKQECYKKLARKLNDLNLCNKLEDEYSKEECISDIVTSVEDCEKMKDSKADCYRNLAKKVDNPNICNKIEAEDLKENCMIGTVRNRGSCEQIEKGYLKDKCIFRYAGLIEDCYKIEDEQLEKICIETYYKGINKVLNKEIEYSGTLTYEDGNLVICGDCFGVGMRYEYAGIEWLAKEKCCYVLDLSHYKKPIGEENRSIKLKVIVRKPECEALKFDISSDRSCILGCECNRIFFEVKEVIEQ